MEHNLNIRTFGFFKIITGFLILSTFFVAREFMMILSIFLPVTIGKAHSLGAWMGMWRAGMLNKLYIFSMVLLTICITYLGIFVFPLWFLTLITSALFLIHFILDEYELQGESFGRRAIFLPISFLTISILALLVRNEFLNVPFWFYLVCYLVFSVAHYFFNRKITWNQINLNLVNIFLLIFIYRGVDPYYFVGMILLWHYFFWFIYPVYKLHKYKREERDGFIFILILIILSSVFLAFKNNLLTPEVKEYSIRYFDVITIVHILGTTPFGHLFGLPKKKKYANS